MHVSKRGSAGARKKAKGHYVRKGKVCQPRSLTPFRQLGAHGALSAFPLRGNAREEIAIETPDSASRGTFRRDEQRIKLFKPH